MLKYSQTLYEKIHAIHQNYNKFHRLDNLNAPKWVRHLGDAYQILTKSSANSSDSVRPAHIPALPPEWTLPRLQEELAKSRDFVTNLSPDHPALWPSKMRPEVRKHVDEAYSRYVESVFGAGASVPDLEVVCDAVKDWLRTVPTTFVDKYSRYPSYRSSYTRKYFTNYNNNNNNNYDRTNNYNTNKYHTSKPNTSYNSNRNNNARDEEPNNSTYYNNNNSNSNRNARNRPRNPTSLSGIQSNTTYTQDSSQTNFNSNTKSTDISDSNKIENSDSANDSANDSNDSANESPTYYASESTNSSANESTDSANEYSGNNTRNHTDSDNPQQELYYANDSSGNNSATEPANFTNDSPNFTNDSTDKDDETSNHNDEEPNNDNPLNEKEENNTVGPLLSSMHIIDPTTHFGKHSSKS